MKGVSGFLLLMCVLLTTNSCKKRVEGCTDPDSFNYNIEANIDDGTCLYDDYTIKRDTIYGCTDPNGQNYNPDANIDDGSCIIFGCTDPNADNYNPNATQDDGSCIDSRIKFGGDYNVITDCPLLMNDSSNFSYNLSVPDTIYIDPIFLLGGVAYGLVSKDSITVPSQVVGVVTIDGSGYMNTTQDTVWIDYNYNLGSCSNIYVKQ